MKRFSTEEIVAVTVTLLLLTFGYVLAVKTCPTTFARFGALAVCIGIILAVIDLKGIWQDSYAATTLDKSNALKHLAEITNPSKSEQNAEIYKNNKKIVSDIFDSILENASNRKSQAMIIEAVIIILGTVVWGFGDLMVYDFGYFSYEKFACT